MLLPQSCFLHTVAGIGTGLPFLLFTELEVRRDRGALGQHPILLTVEDPKVQVGSGGATLNALLVAAEHLSARAGYTVRECLLGSYSPWVSCSLAVLEHQPLNSFSSMGTITPISGLPGTRLFLPQSISSPMQRTRVGFLHLIGAGGVSEDTRRHHLCVGATHPEIATSVTEGCLPCNQCSL